MARFDYSGMEELSMSFKELASMPDGLLSDMLNAEAGVIIPAQKNMAASMGVVDSGQMAASIKAGKVKRLSDGASMTVYPQGSRTRGRTTTRNAEIAFINEYGKKGQSPRPFIRTANEQYADQAVDAAFKVYDHYLDSKNL